MPSVRDHSKRRPILGFFLIVLNIPILIGAVGLQIWGRAEDEPFLPIFLGLVLAVIAVTLINMGRCFIRLRATDVLSRDNRPPVLYLRSFKADGKGQPPMPLGGGLVPMLIGDVARSSFEDRLGHILSAIGPFIAIGNPEESGPPKGAARLYLSNEEWKERITELLSRAACVVVQAGSSQGLAWELETISKKCDPTKLVIGLPAGSSEKAVDCAEFERFREITAHIFKQPLPDISKDSRFICFDDSWKPFLVYTGKKRVDMPQLGDHNPKLQLSVLEHLRRGFRRSVTLEHKEALRHKVA
jgi:hypothetical protein